MKNKAGQNVLFNRYRTGVYGRIARLKNHLRLDVHLPQQLSAFEAQDFEQEVRTIRGQS